MAAFGASLASGFHFDDYAIFSDRVLTSSSGWIGVWALRQTRPLTYLTFWLNYLAGGQDPLGYHLVNLALHVAAVLLGYDCLRRLIPDRAALVAAAIFALHPLQAEAVNYVWARSILLAAVLCLALWRAWLDGRVWVAVAWFAAAMLANPECAAFPAVLWIIGRHPKAGSQPAPHRRAALAVMVALAVTAGGRVVYAAGGLHAGKYFLAQGAVILRYLRLLVVPHGFTIDPDIRTPAVWAGALAWAAVLGLAVWAWRERARGWTVWLLGGLILLLPSSSVFPAADLAADRRMYLPMLGFAAAAGMLLGRIKSPAPSAALASTLLVLSLIRTSVWMSDASLWREAVRRAPDKVRPKVQLSRTVPAGQALELLTAARNLAPYDPSVPAEMGKVLLEEKQVEAALIEFGHALALEPNNAQHHNNRGVALSLLGQTEAARADFKEALAIDPGLTEASENLRKLPPEQ